MMMNGCCYQQNLRKLLIEEQLWVFYYVGCLMQQDFLKCREESQAYSLSLVDETSQEVAYLRYQKFLELGEPVLQH